MQESLRREWNGDVDLGNGVLERLKSDYDGRVDVSESVKKVERINRKDLKKVLSDIGETLKFDMEFLSKGLGKGVEVFRMKFNQVNAPEETLKSLNLDIVEFHTLLGQASDFSIAIKDSLNILDQKEINHPVADARKCWLKHCKNYLVYLRNLWKKKRECATHILVFMLLDERRDKNPYAIPLQYVPYHSIRDQELRDLVKNITLELTKANLKVVGTTTDGEFEQLRRRGDTRPLHIWQLAHDAKESVRKMNKTTLLQMLQLIQGE